MPALLDHLRRGLSDYSLSDRIQACQEVPVLVLDDLGAEVRDERTDEWLYKILNHRALYDGPTVMSCNATRAQLEARIADRLDECARVVFVIASSYRAEIRRQRDVEQV